MSDAAEAGSGGGRGRAQRLPRWTRQEILVLIEGKRVVERSGRGRGRGQNRAGGGGEGTAAEPTKWAAVAEYCRRHGVDRGPVQCRKRWSNLAGDYKKIKEWEKQHQHGASGEPSFWAMRNDARKERRLPGFFDCEVYDILEGRGGGSNVAAPPPPVGLVVGKEISEKPAVLDSSGARASAVGLFSSSWSSDKDDDNDEEATPPPPSPTPAPAPLPVAVSISEKPTEIPRQASSQQGRVSSDSSGLMQLLLARIENCYRPIFNSAKTRPINQAGTSKRKELNEVTQDSPVHGRQKKQRSGEGASGRATTDGRTTDLQGQLIHILDWSGRMLAAQLEAQNINSQLDREQRKEQVSSLLSVLGKMADGLYRIADKL